LSLGGEGNTVLPPPTSQAPRGDEEGVMKFAYVVTTGTDNPTRASLPLHLAANGSVEVGHEVVVLLAGDATEMLFGENLDQMQGVGVPPVRELLTKLRDHAVPVYV
jgi:predicted peroxiredoxin